MKRESMLLVITLVFLTACNQPQQSTFPVLKGPYLGQIPPGTTPVVFAPGIVSTGLYTRDIAISNDGQEIYFCVSDAATTSIFITQLVNNKWTEPVIAPFSGKGFFDMEPSISPDGTKFFFLSNRPPSNKEPGNGWHYQNIWMMHKTGKGWSEPELVDKPVSTDESEFFPSVTAGNTLYFSRMVKSGKAMIYKSRFENGKYAEPEMLPFDILEKGILFNAFVSPKEDFLITCGLNVDSTNTDQDYYISFKSADGKWSKLIKLGPEINTPGDNANSPYVSRDGKYLFFNSSRKDTARPQIKTGSSIYDIIKSKSLPGYGSSAIYWVDAKIIDELRRK